MASNHPPYPYSGSRTQPSPPSPSSSSPGLTQSTSNSSCSPPQPATPPRRQNPRQSDQGRVPLHRRGTSRTYENFEDLLREAGYKETRIYTPETDRIETHACDEEGGRPAGKVQGVRATVVGFLAGLVAGTGNDTAASRSRQDQAASNAQRPRLLRTQSPSSPLTDRQQASYRRENVQGIESIESRTPMTSSIESLGDPTPKAGRRQTHLHRQNQSTSQPSTPNSAEERSSVSSPRYTAYSDHHTPDSSHLPHPPLQHQHHPNSAAPSRIHNQPSWSSITTPSNNNVISLDPSSNDPSTSSSNNSTIVINEPAPSRAGTYLRHVISTPTIVPPQPPKSPYRNSSAEGSQALSRKWFDSVARVLMFGAATTPLGYTTSPTSSNAPTPNILQSPSALTFSPHIQRPSSFNHLHFQHQHHYQHHPHHRTLRPSRSSISQTTYRSALSATTTTTTTTRQRLELRDQTNIGALTPPVFLTRLGRERAPYSQGQVSKTRVYCQSAPASRAPSPSRSTFYLRNKNENSNNKKNGLKGGKVGRGLGKRELRHHVHGGRGTTGSRGKNVRRKKGDEESTRVPTLAKTRVEGDAWHKGGGKGRRSGVSENSDDPFSSSDNYRHHHIRLHHHDDDHDGEDGDELYGDEDEGDYDEDEDEEDEEGELDLARMLVNPKRQQSIRSLRKHLHHSQRLLTTSPTAFMDSSKSGDSSSNATHPDNNKSIVRPSLSRLHSYNHPTNRQRRFVSGRQPYQGDDDTAGQWERQWRSGELSSSRRGSEDDDLYESLTWLNDDKDGGRKRKNNGSMVGLVLPRPWNSNNASQVSR